MVTAHKQPQITNTALRDTFPILKKENTQTDCCVSASRLHPFTDPVSQALVPSFSAARPSLAVVPCVMRVGGATDTSRWLLCLEWLSI